jgi:PAS domain S-box-containing protein
MSDVSGPAAMMTTTSSTNDYPAPRAWAAAAVTVGIVAALAVVDVVLGLRANLSVLYPAALFPCIWTRSRRMLWGATALALVLTVVSGFAEGSDTRAWLNRACAAVATVGTAVMLHRLFLSWDELRQRSTEAEAANRDLVAREEEIARQNEELQSQTEELERQSEELRIANEELANREKTLEHLLALSRSLTADLKRSQIMQIVCETMGFLMSGRAPASAIIERRDGVATVACHYGFHGGLRQDAFPADSAFASLVLNRNQTAYLDDLSLRPDLIVPQPLGGEPVRSVLATPLRVKGRAIGTLEIYSHDRRSWNEEHVALLESLAAQTSISLEAAELFEEIDQERRRFEAVFRTLPIGVAVTDAGFGEVRVNPAGLSMLGLPAETNLADPDDAQRIHVFNDGRRLAPSEWTTARALRGEEVAPAELEIVAPAGRRVTVLASAAPIRDRERRIVGAVAAFTDIGPHKALQRELDRRRREAEEASVRKTRFLAAVSHDIRTPANAINLLAELMKRTAANPAMAAEIPQMADELQASATSLVNLVSDVLDITRFDSGKIDLHETEFRLHDAIGEEARQLAPLAAAKGIELVVEPVMEPLVIRGDRIKLGRVLSNLVGNAIKFTQKGHVRVGVGLTSDRRVCVRVEDTGVGIAPEHQIRIFDEFFQLRNPERDPGKGTGLGLTICKRLIEAMEGELLVESIVGKGSTFTVMLPAVVIVPDGFAAPAAPTADVSSAPSLAGFNILLVEDHASTRQTQRLLLEREGATVAEAADGQSALRLLKTTEPRVLLLDVVLPDMTGQDVLRAIAQDRPASLATILVLTGSIDEQTATEVRALGADALIAKPVNVRQLVHAIRGQQD